MSKRKSQTAIDDYIAEGFVREALVNFLALLGWSTGTDEDVLSLDEIVERFDLDAVQKGGAVFDRVRLEWLNGQWIRRLPDADLVERLLPFLEADWAAGRIDRNPARDEVVAILPLVRERMSVLGAIGDQVGFLFRDAVDLDPALLVPKRWERGTALAGLAAARGAVEALGGRRVHGRRPGGRRCAPQPRRTAGRRATSSWRSGWPSPGRRPRRRCSSRWSSWGASERSSGWTARRTRWRRSRPPDPRPAGGMTVPHSLTVRQRAGNRWTYPVERWPARSSSSMMSRPCARRSPRRSTRTASA